MLLSRLSLLYTRNRRASARGLGDLLHEFQVVASAGRSQECDRFEQFPHGAMLCVFTSQSALPTAPDHCSKDADAFLHDPVGVVHLEIPGSRHRVLVISPAEGALVRTGHGGRCFHALVRVDPIESVLVTLALAEDGIPSPAALLHSTVAPHEAIAALGHVLAVLRLHHPGSARAPPAPPSGPLPPDSGTFATPAPRWHRDRSRRPKPKGSCQLSLSPPALPGPPGTWHGGRNSKKIKVKGPRAKLGSREGILFELPE